MSFRTLSDQFHKTYSKTERQSKGIFFTPLEARTKIFDYLKSISFQPNSILEPSFGSGEFLWDCLEYYPNATLYGVERDEGMFESVNSQSHLDWQLTCDDFRNIQDLQVDLIVGNPPYFVVPDKEPKCMTGRGNIFVLFLYKCLTQHLNTNGILAFVLPTSFYNCQYYEPCRKYIYEHTTIIHVESINVNYYETQQDTMILILQNTPPVDPSRYILQIESSIYINPFAYKLKDAWQTRKSLKQWGFQVKTGDIVWNQHKEKLSNNEGKLLVYTTNLSNGRLIVPVTFSSKEKKQYIQMISKKPLQGPAILVARGYGNNYQFQYAFVQEDQVFYGENHVNVILPKTQEAKEAIPRILEILSSDYFREYRTLFIGNGALSKTELESRIPF